MSIICHKISGNFKENKLNKTNFFDNFYTIYLKQTKDWSSYFETSTAFGKMNFKYL